MSSKQITSLTKQNDGMFTSLTKRDISFTRVEILDTMTDEEKLSLLQEENTQLKAVIQANKPPPEPKKEKVRVEKPPEEPKEKPKEFHTYTNLEDMKRAFFGNEFDSYIDMVKEHPFKFYQANYKFNEDNDGREPYIACNLQKGLVRNVDKLGKYFMLVFRCWKLENENKYQYETFWLLNSQDSINEIAKNIYDDFTFEEIDFNTFDTNFRRIPENTVVNSRIMISESYVH